MMAPSTLLGEAERYKFNTIFSNNGSTFQHTIPANPLMAMGRCETWKRVKLLARGAFGTVWLESEEKGQQLRAVKRIAKTTNALHLRELLTLTKLTVVCKYPFHFRGRMTPLLKKLNFSVVSETFRPVLWLVRERGGYVLRDGVCQAW
jgi:hypothetical protein